MADLSNHLIAITTGFVGTEVVLFGATDGPGDVAVVIQGPPTEVMVRRKSRVAGIWINTARMEFQQVPSFYSVATNRPLEQIIGDAVLARHEIGLDHLRLPPESGRASPDRVREFREALIRNKQEEGLYGKTHGQVAFLGERLFRTNVYFPANVPTGAYTGQRVPDPRRRRGQRPDHAAGRQQGRRQRRDFRVRHETIHILWHFGDNLRGGGRLARRCDLPKGVT